MKEQVEVIFAADNITWLEAKHIMTIILESFKTVEQVFTQYTEVCVQKMESKILGIDSMNDLTMQKLEKVLTSPVEESSVE